MTFRWLTSFIGYPNFFKDTGHSYELAQSFVALAKASLDGINYKEAKRQFPNLDPAQVETKKAAFQEYGLLYVVPRSNIIALTPVGKHIYKLVIDSQVLDKDRRVLLFTLARALARYQFDNPLPVGGNRSAFITHQSDVLPYLVCYYLLLKLDGILTVSELKGAVFGLQHMRDLCDLEKSIKDQRKSRTPFNKLASLPSNKKTAENLKIYFVSHLSLDGEILKNTTTNLYGFEEQAFELTEFGYELIESVVTDQWSQWESTIDVPRARDYAKNVQDYFNDGIGQMCPPLSLENDARRAEATAIKTSEGVLDPYDIENLKQLTHSEYQEGKQRLVQHTRLEKVRNSALVREAKRLFIMERGRLFCEVCRFDFETKYGERGKDYIEAHHKFPISQLAGMVSVSIIDLAMVCSNCHRMLHRPPWVTVEELIEIIQRTESGT